VPITANRAVRRALMIAVTLRRPIYSVMAVLRTISCHFTRSICLWQRMRKASRRLLSNDKRVHDSKPYKKTRTIHVMYTRSFVCRDIFCLQIRDNEPIEDAAISIRRYIAGDLLPDESWMLPR